ncbi:hypothetical protein JTB14_005267 [Gonioctena quinquepunctata]|nr:hypothetical protein JTB14_005267 [Gonioctena quinquepunctata]
MASKFIILAAALAYAKAELTGTPAVATYSAGPVLSAYSASPVLSYGAPVSKSVTNTYTSHGSPVVSAYAARAPVVSAYSAPAYSAPAYSHRCICISSPCSCRH